MKTTHKALLAVLTDISGIGEARAYELHSHYDDPMDLLSAPATLTDEYHYVDETTLTQIRSSDDEVEQYRDRFKGYESSGITVLAITEDRYPQAIRAGPAPALVYAKGDIDLLFGDKIGISGSRETNEVGQQWVESLSSELGDRGHTLVSGGARGADTAAHRGALDTADSTVVVLGSGVNVAYPPENESLFNDIVDTGGLLVSMRLPDADPTRHAFLDRNELIAALSDKLIFVATDGTGGTMAQYKMALKQDVPVYAPSTDLNIAPADGLVTIREASDTAGIATASDLLDTTSVEAGEQKQLDEWS